MPKFYTKRFWAWQILDMKRSHLVSTNPDWTNLGVSAPADSSSSVRSSTCSVTFWTPKFESLFDRTWRSADRTRFRFKDPNWVLWKM